MAIQLLPNNASVNVPLASNSGHSRRHDSEDWFSAWLTKMSRLNIRLFELEGAALTVIRRADRAKVALQVKQPPPGDQRGLHQWYARKDALLGVHDKIDFCELPLIQSRHSRHSNFPLPHRFPLNFKPHRATLEACGLLKPCVPHHFNIRFAACLVAGNLLLFNAMTTHSAEPNWEEKLESLRQQNIALQETVRKQATEIESLSRRIATVETTAAKKETAPAAPATAAPEAHQGGIQFGRVNLSGEGGIAVFDSQRNGAFPNTEFRVDEAKLFVEAQVWEDIYFFSELNLVTRDASDLNLRVGEIYLDFENVSRLWNCDRLLNIRIGRMDIPFGEEYLTRDAIDNPLISHSLTDTWGTDAGVEFYGAVGKFSYVAAVQSGGAPETRDFTRDKSMTARLSYDPTSWLHLSLSALRTGELDANNDYWSAVWFGGGWFRSIGSPSTTTYHAEQVQGDVALNFSRGHIKAFAGVARYDDNDPTADNRRDFFYYTVEGVYDVTPKFYAAARFSQVFVEDGYPLPGNGDLNTYYYNPALQAEELWRLSLGLGYRLNPRVLIKAEYSFEGGKEISGAKREDVDFMAFETAFKF